MTRPGGILALDLASVVGWAYGHADANVPALCGSWHLPKGGLLGARFAAYENELIDALDLHRPRLVVMEAPLPANRQASTDVARQQFGLAAYTEGECWRRKVQLREQPAHMVRHTVMGKVPRGGTDEIKRQVMRFCQLVLKANPSDHNAADALILFEYSRLVERNQHRTAKLL